MANIVSTNTSRQNKNDPRDSGAVGGVGFVLYNRKMMKIAFIIACKEIM